MQALEQCVRNLTPFFGSACTFVRILRKVWRGICAVYEVNAEGHRTSPQSAAVCSELCILASGFLECTELQKICFQVPTLVNFRGIYKRVWSLWNSVHISQTALSLADLLVGLGLFKLHQHWIEQSIGLEYICFTSNLTWISVGFPVFS
jgi:hypothetical protein